MVNSLQKNNIFQYLASNNPAMGNKQAPVLLQVKPQQSSFLPQIQTQTDVFKQFRKLPVVQTEIKGHLVRGYHPIDAMKDWGKIGKGFFKALNGESKDYTLGRINGAAVGLGSLGIATVLGFMNKKAAPHSRAMEFVGLTTWLGSMQLWPKLFIGAPLKAMTGVDVNQKYVNYYGDRKRVFEDPQYIPFDLYTNDEINKIGNKLGMPVNMANRREAVENKMKQIATQSNTLWMLTAGLSTPILSSLMADKLEPSVSKFIQEFNIASASRKLKDLREINFKPIERNKEKDKSINKPTENVANAGKDAAKKAEKVLYNTKLSLHRKGVKFVAEYTDKALSLITPAKLHHKPVLFTDKNTPEQIKNVFNKFFTKTQRFDYLEVDVIKDLLNGMMQNKKVKAHEEANNMYKNLIEMDKSRAIMDKAYFATFGRMEGSGINAGTSIFAKLYNKLDTTFIKELGLPKHIDPEDLNENHIIDHLNNLKREGSLDNLLIKIQDMKKHYLEQLPTEVVEHFTDKLKNITLTEQVNKQNLIELQSQFFNKYSEDVNLKKLGIESTFVRWETLIGHIKEGKIEKPLMERVVKGIMPTVSDHNKNPILELMYGKNHLDNKIIKFFSEHSSQLNDSLIIKGKDPVDFVKDALTEVTNHNKWFKRVGIAGLITLGATAVTMMNFGKANKYNPDPSMARRDK